LKGTSPVFAISPKTTTVLGRPEAALEFVPG
jgi:hypothetical protein